MQKFIHAGDFGSDHCQRVAGMLVCQCYFPLCDECLSGHSFLASREECETVSIMECEKEWTMARQYGISLPNCSNLPKQLIGENHSDAVKQFEITQMHDCTFVQENATIGRLLLLYNPFIRVYHICAYVNQT